MPTTPPSRHPAAEDGHTQNTPAGQILRPWTDNRTALGDRAILNVIATASDAATSIETTLIEAVDAARKSGFSWAEIGTSLGTTGNDARARYGSAVD